MNVFDTPEFLAAHQVRGGSPFRSLTRSQQSDLLIALQSSVSSLLNHPGFSENDSRTDADVKAVNDILIDLVNTIVCFFILSIYFFPKFHFRFSQTFLLPFSFAILTGFIPSATSLANITFPAPMLVLAAQPKIPSYLYFESLVSRNNFAALCTLVVLVWDSRFVFSDFLSYNPVS
jgi:hypothetical protein